jgi:MFS family permease
MAKDTGLLNRFISLQLFRAFRHRNFPLLFLSTITFSIGHYVVMVALGWLVLEMTDSPLSVGMVWAARSTPYFLFGILAGAVADRVDRRRLLIYTFLLMAACAFTMGILIGQGWIQFWHVLALTFVMGTLMTFDMTARQSFVVDIVGAEDAMSSLSMNSVALRMMGIFSGAAAGLIIELLGIEWCFFTMVIGYLLGTIALISIRGVVRKASAESPSIRENFVEGLKIIARNQIILILAVMAIICEIFAFSHLAILPVFARDVLKAGAIGLGMLTTMGSVGGLLALLVLASLGDYRYKGRLIIGILLGYGIALILFSQSPWYSVSLMLITVVGGMAAAFDAMQHTMLQLNVADEQRGRAMGIWQLSIGFGPVGQLTIGAVATLLGAQLALTINGAVIIAVFAVLIAIVPRLRQA